MLPKVANQGKLGLCNNSVPTAMFINQVTVCQLTVTFCIVMLNITMFGVIVLIAILFGVILLCIILFGIIMLSVVMLSVLLYF